MSMVTHGMAVTAGRVERRDRGVVLDAGIRTGETLEAMAVGGVRKNPPAGAGRPDESGQDFERVVFSRP
jgi:hypothetical protein